MASDKESLVQILMRRLVSSPLMIRLLFKICFDSIPHDIRYEKKGSGYNFVNIYQEMIYDKIILNILLGIKFSESQIITYYYKKSKISSPFP